MTDKKRPLRDRLLMSRYMNTDIIIETVDELDRLSQHREATGCHNTADLERIKHLEKERDVFRECLEVAEHYLLRCKATNVQDEISKIKHKAGIK